MPNSASSQFVAVASIAAELSAVLQVAKEISLAAANAKAIAFRAGEKAKGFKPITDFINELAKDTMAVVNRINADTLNLYRLTVAEQRMRESSRRFDMAVTAAAGARHVDSLLRVRETARLQAEICHGEFSIHVDDLLSQLSGILYPARAARVIAANSRIEASQAGEYLQSLQAVAESVDHAAQIINEKVNKCRGALVAISADYAQSNEGQP